MKGDTRSLDSSSCRTCPSVDVTMHMADLKPSLHTSAKHMSSTV